MDNKINEIRRKISVLRARMLDAEPGSGQPRPGLHGSVPHVDEHAPEMLSLIGQRNALGGWETCPNIAERLRENYRPVRKVLGKSV